MLQINSTNMPEPSTFDYEYQDIDGEDANRTESGIMQRDRVRANVHKLSLSWKALNGADTSTILQATSSESFNVTFSDALINASFSAKMYAGSKNVKSVATALGIRYDVSFDLIEY